jgi:hypothetical protein
MPLPIIIIDRPHCYNKEVVPVGKHLNSYHIHDSFIPFLFLFLMTAGSILHRHMSVSKFMFYFSGYETSWK